MLTELMTTRYPLCCVVMERAARMKATVTSMELTWAPRTTNHEADALTKEDFRGSDMAKRIPVDIASINFLVLREMMAAGSAFDAERQAIKQDAKIAKAGLHRKRRKGERLRDVDLWYYSFPAVILYPDRPPTRAFLGDRFEVKYHIF